MKRYNYLNFLNGYQNQVLTTALGNSSNSSKTGQYLSSSSSSDNLTEQLNNVILQTLTSALKL